MSCCGFLDEKSKSKQVYKIVERNGQLVWDLQYGKLKFFFFPTHGDMELKKCFFLYVLSIQNQGLNWDQDS